MDVLLGELPDNDGREQRAEEFSQIALELHGADDAESTIERIVDFARSALASDDAGVMLVHTRSKIETAAATSEPVARAHTLQVELDEGPCLDALESTSTIYRIDDTELDERWPRWSKHVVALGFRSVLSAPLATLERRYGSINVYAARPGAFEPDDEAVASILARHASVALAASHNIDGLRRAVDARKLIGMAMGMIMERYGLDADRAFGVLRRYSQDHNVKLRDVAQQVVEERVLPRD